MRLTTRRLIEARCEEFDAVDSKVEIVQTASGIILAHWKRQDPGTGRIRDLWAVASTIPEMVKGALDKRLDFPLAARAVPFGVPPLGATAPAPDQVQYLYFTDLVPKDPDFNLQREALDVIDLTRAWDFQTGRRDVKVAIVDTGVAYRHPDLQSNIAIDAKGAILGRDFQTGSPDADDAQWHGTFCAGLVGAVGGDNFGMTGVCWEVSLMPVKALGEEGFGTNAQTAAAINFAVEHEADVILCAWGSEADSPDLKKALQSAQKKGVVVVAAAGNSSSQETDVHYPASYSQLPDPDNLDNIISVGATNAQNQALPTLAPAHLYAPGERVYSTFPPHLRPYVPYHVGGGTSAAAALVAGACALVMAQLKALGKEKMSPLQLREWLVKTAESIASADGKLSTAVRLNVGKALKDLSASDREAARQRRSKKSWRSKARDKTKGTQKDKGSEHNHPSP